VHTPPAPSPRRVFPTGAVRVAGFSRRSTIARSRALALLVARALFPLVTLALLLSVPVIGPYWFLLAVFCWWRLVTIVA